MFSLRLVAVTTIVSIPLDGAFAGCVCAIAGVARAAANAPQTHC